jgi:hypothetical protein
VNEQLASKASVLKGHSLPIEAADDLIVLRAGYQTIAKASVGVFLIGIAELERKIKLAVRILHADVEVAFGRSSVTRPYLVFNWTQAQRDTVCSDYSSIRVELQHSAALCDDDPGIHKRKIERGIVTCACCSRGQADQWCDYQARWP